MYAVFLLLTTPLDGQRSSLKQRTGPSGKTGKIFIFIIIIILLFRQIIFCLLNYHNDSNTIPITFTMKFKLQISRRYFQPLQKFHLELNVIFISGFCVAADSNTHLAAFLQLTNHDLGIYMYGFLRRSSV